MLASRLLAVPVTAILGLTLVPAAAQAAPAPNVAAAASASSSSTALRVATFNVRTARATQDKRPWLKRAPDVAREILSRKPGVVALQELGPGRADGKKGTLKGHMRQTTSLTRTLKRQGGGRYRLVRETPYFKPGTTHGTQGARILFDSSRYTLKTRCPEKTGTRNYNTSCAFDLPLAKGDSKRLLRSAAYAEFADKRTGKRFFVVSAHLDSRHSHSNTYEAKYNRLRASQARAVVKKLARVNPAHRPVIFGGDINSWQTDRGRYAPHRVLVSAGYRDTATAAVRVNNAYTTVNHYDVRLKRSKRGNGVRLDVLMVKGGRSVTRYENKMSVVDRARPSDHNMGVADIRL